MVMACPEMISEIGYKKIRELIEQLGSAEELMKTSVEILSEQLHIAPIISVTCRKRQAIIQFSN